MAEQNLGRVSPAIWSTSAPADTNVLWAHIIDPQSPKKVVWKYHDGNDWGPLSSNKYYLEPVLDIVEDPPANPQVGDRYIIDQGGTGAFAANATRIAEYSSTGWVYTTPLDGSTCYVINLKNNLYFRTDKWVGSEGTRIWITDIQSARVIIKNEVEELPGEYVVYSAEAESATVTVFLSWENSQHYVGQLSVNGVAVTNVAHSGGRFSGQAQITLDELQGNGVDYIVVKDAYGGFHSIKVDVLPTAPAIESVVYDAYPGGQSELKSGDLIGATITFAESNVAVTQLQATADGPFNAQTIAVTPDVNREVHVDLEILHSVSQATAQDLTGILRSVNENGSVGPDYSAPALSCNNLAPSFTFNDIAYPVGQQAIKSGESADVDVTVNDANSMVYSSPNGELTIPNTGVYAQIKAVSYLSGSYNLITPNFRIVATRAANGAQNTLNLAVAIAEANPTIDLAVPAARLRSGVVAVNHQVTLSSDQDLIEAPVITAPAGALQGSMSGAGDTWTQNLAVADGDAKGTYSFGLTSAKNLAGRVVNAINAGAQYVLGGFTGRTFQIAAGGLVGDIGTVVVDTAKLTASADDPPMALNYVAPGSVDNANDNYTIINDNQVQLSAGFLSLNADRVKNITIEETV